MEDLFQPIQDLRLSNYPLVEFDLVTSQDNFASRMDAYPKSLQGIMKRGQFFLEQLEDPNQESPLQR